jgi:streptogramin lyase
MTAFYRPTLLTALCLALLGACSAPGMAPGAPSTEAPVREGAPLAGTLTLVIRHQPARQVQAVLADVAGLSVTVRGWGGTTRMRTLDAASLLQGQASVSFDGLPAAQVEVTLKALDVDGRVIGATTQVADMSPGRPTQVAMSVQLEPVYLGSPAPGGVAPQVHVTQAPPVGTWGQPLPIGGYGLTAAPDGHLWVLEATSRLKKIAPDGTVAITTAPLPSRAAPYTMGQQLATDGDGNLWVLHADQLSKLSPSGAVIATHPAAGAKNLATDSQGQVWLGTLQGVRCLSPDGAEVAAYPLGAPTWAIAVDPATDLVWALTEAFGGTELVRLSAAGGEQGRTHLTRRSAEVAIAADGHAWVLSQDLGMQDVEQVAPDGRIVGRHGVGLAQALAFDATGHLWTVFQRPDTQLPNNVRKYTPGGLRVGSNNLPSGDISPIRGLIRVSAGDLWLLTEMSLTKLTP